MTLEELFAEHMEMTHPGANEEKVQELRRIFLAGLFVGFAQKDFTELYAFGARTKAAPGDRNAVGK